MSPATHTPKRDRGRIKQLPNAVRMQIKDDGRAFDVERLLHSRKNKRMGLLGMRERVEMVGGKFTVESTPGQWHDRYRTDPVPERRDGSSTRP